MAILLTACGKNDAGGADASDAQAHVQDASTDAPDATGATIADAAIDADADADALPDADTSTDADADAAPDAGADADANADADADATRGCSGPLTVQDAGGACNVVIQSWPDEGHTHVTEGSDVHYCTEPPSSGNHYPVWANYTTYDRPIAPGYLVHDLEHGAVVITYRCASSCPDIASQLQAVVDSHGLDPICSDGIAARLVLAPDPNLDVAVAAAAWTWTYRATCVDAASLRAFMNGHYGQGTEATCAPGITPP